MTVDTSIPLEWRAVFFLWELCSDWNHHQEMNLVCISCLRLGSLCATAQPWTAGEGRTERKRDVRGPEKLDEGTPGQGLSGETGFAPFAFSIAHFHSSIFAD